MSTETEVKEVTVNDIMSGNQEIMKKISESMETSIYKTENGKTVLNLYPSSNEDQDAIIDFAKENGYSYMLRQKDSQRVVKIVILGDPDEWIEDNMKGVLQHSSGVTLAGVVTNEEKLALNL